MFVTCFSAIKGGVGKSSLTILLTKFIAKIVKKKVLVIDLDFQNSTSFHFLEDEDERNVANALFDNQIRENIIEINDRISILQSLHPGSLRNLLKNIQDDFDWCIIDTKPDYNNIVLNGLLAADLIITPVSIECFFDLKTALFLNEQLTLEYPEVLPKWKLLLTRVRKALSENSLIHEYEDNYRNYFNNILCIRIPDTKLIGRLIDSDSEIKNTRVYNKVFVNLSGLFDEIDKYRKEALLHGQITG